MSARDMTSIYLVCFHSESPGPKSLEDSKGQFLKVETAISKGEWPYDNGDDPSFYAARRGGALTWGVCRQDLRNAIKEGSIVVFFSFTPVASGEILYRLCAVATVEQKLDHRALQSDRRLVPFQHLYVNGLIKPERHGWRYDETDRGRSYQHNKDWLWRIADHRVITQANFNKKHEAIYHKGWFADAAAHGLLRRNYILFATSADLTFIAPNPPEVARSTNGKPERWTHRLFQEMTLKKAWSLSRDKRQLRVANPSRRNVHRQIHFKMPPDEATKWRSDLIAALAQPKAKASSKLDAAR